MSRFISLQIADVRQETADAVSVSFTIPAQQKDAFQFIQGQYITLKLNVKGEEIRRSYSICSGTEDGELRVAVKRVKGGKGSNYINDLLDLDTALRKLQKNNSNLYKALVGVFVFGNPIQEQARLMNVSKRQINRRLDDGLHVLTMIMNGDMYED